MINFLFTHRESIKVLVLFVSSTFFGYKVNEKLNPPRVISGLSKAAFDSLVVERNKNKNLQTAISDLTDDNTELVALLTMQPPEIVEKIEYVVRVVNKIKPVETVRTVTVEVPTECEEVLPPQHVFYLQPKFPVASFIPNRTSTGIDYRYNTAELEFDLNLIIDTENTTGLLTAKSSLNPDYVLRLSPTITTTKIQKPHQYLDLDLGLGASLLWDQEDLYLNGILSYFKITDDLALFSLSYLFNSNNYHFGINLLNYRIAKHMPVFENIWLDAGVYIGPGLPWHIGISSRF